MKIVIIGGGPSGLTAALNAKNDHNEIIILEKNNNVLKKLLVTGAGHCNLFNKEINIDCYNSSDKDILNKIITEDNISLVMPFLEGLGIVCKNKGNYIYPMAYTAYSVQNALIMACKSKNIDIRCNEEVISVKKEGNLFTIKTKTNTYTADKLIVSTGSKAYPNLGSSDIAINIAKSFGINTLDFLPSLTGLKIDNKITKKWDKLRCDVKLSHFEDNKFIKSEVGEVQLTSYGISGICTFNLSSRIIKNLNNHKEEIIIDFLPELDTDFKSLIKDRINRFPHYNVIELLEGLINYKILYALFDDIKLIKKESQDFNDKDIDLIINMVKSYKVTITGHNDFDSAQVSSGGIRLTEINESNFESLKVKDLYFIGEALDVDGICGGYNLGFAWISGILCGKSINNCL